MRDKPSRRARLLTWLLWHLPLKRRFADTHNLRDRVLRSRPKRLRPPAHLTRRYQVVTTDQDGRPIYTLTATRSQPKLHVLYLHGGAYVYEIAGPQWGLVHRLMQRLDLAVTVPLYPLAPEHTCPEVLSFLLATYESLLGKAGGLPVVLLGDSAGGGLALALAQQLREAGRPLPAALVLVSPWLDVTCSDPRQPALEHVDPLLALPGLRLNGEWYAGTLSPTDPHVSPLFGDLTGLPPTLALTGTHDVLNPDVHRLETAMRGAESALQVREYRDMLHVWPAMPLPEATEAFDDITSFLISNLQLR